MAQRLVDPYMPERETLGEVLNNLGVPVERPNKAGVTGAKWFDNRNRKMTNRINLSRSGLYLPGFVITKSMPGPQVAIGVGEYDGEKVILIKHDPNGFKFFTPKKGGRRYISANKKLCDQMLAAGLKPGLYKPTKIKDGWIGVPEK